MIYLCGSTEHLRHLYSACALLPEVQACMQSFAEKKYEETAILVERISNSLIEDEKRLGKGLKQLKAAKSSSKRLQDRFGLQPL